MKYLRKFNFRSVAGVLGLVMLAATAVPLRGEAADSGVRPARLSSVDGGVRLSQGDQILADHALANTPLFEGNQLTTSDDGRAEIQFDDGSVVRISPNSSLQLSVLRQQGGSSDTELVLDRGLAYFELQGDTTSGHIRVRFGDSVVTASGFSVLRLNLDNLPGELAVFSGNAHLEQSNALSLDLHGGESVTLDAADSGRYNLAESIEPDSWDAWNSDRDQALTSQEAARTPATTGVENSNNPAWSDLDANGNWYNVPGQGYVWSPYEAASVGWEPYGCGNWVWTPRFGYIWVSCSSWGYLPYGSGMWNYYDGFGWGWEPGYGSGWWGSGGWTPNVGSGPHRYQPPRRPHGGPVRPHDGGSPIRGGKLYQPYPVITSNRLPDRPTANPIHPRSGPVTIAGNPVQPLRPISSRPTYDHVSGVSGFRGTVISPGNGVTTARPGYGITTARPGYSVWPNPNQGNSGRPSTPNAPSTWYAPRPSDGGSTFRPSAPPSAPPPSAPSRGPSGGGSSLPSRPSGGGGGGSSHVSSGGGGGGASHVSSGGGGGGGGGGSHSSGSTGSGGHH